tara:strand:- start:4450 stop:5571 length:1122 start_codon:yes stop_codon:yes gene_type:complete
MQQEKLLLILHYSPPVHGAAKVGDTILNSSILGANFKRKYIKLESSKNIKTIGKFQFKKILLLIQLFSKVLYNLFFFRPKKIYFTASPKGFAFYRDLIVMMPIKCYAKITNCEIFLHYHAIGINDFCNQSSFKRKLANFFVSKTNIILISKKIKAEISQLDSYKKEFFLENGVKNHLTEKQFSVILEERKKSKKYNVLFLSNMIKTKGYDDVLELANQLKNKNYNDINFHFAGSWSSDNDELFFKNFIKDNNLEDCVKFHGFVAKKAKEKLISEANIFIFPTRYDKEVFPLSILEALSYGLPILAYNKGAVSDIVDDKVGIITNKTSFFDDFLILKNKNINNDVYLASREKYLKNYTLASFEKKLLSILKNEC